MSSKVDQEVYDEIRDTLQIAKRIIIKCDTSNDTDKISDYSQISDSLSYTRCVALKMHNYTGVDVETSEELVKKAMKKKSFHDWLKCKDDRYEITPKIYERMRNIINYQYLNKLQIPTKSSILQEILNYRNKQLYTSDLLELDLYNLGYVWKRLPKSDKYIIVEDTKQVSNRMKYLHQMKEYRKTDRVLIHVERTVAFPLQRSQNVEVIAIASPQLGFIDAKFPTNEQSLDFWLGNILHTIPQNSVFVIEQSNRSGVDFKRTGELPTMHSKKSTMIEWLESYNIPCDSTMHRGELFALIEKHKVHCPPVYKICEILKAAGHDVILRPPELANTGFFTWILKPIFEDKNVTLPMFNIRVVTAMSVTSPDAWILADRRMAAREQKIYEEDLKLEFFLDKLMDAVKSEDFDAVDIEKCETDEFNTEFFDKMLFDAAPVVVKKQPGFLGYML